MIFIIISQSMAMFFPFNIKILELSQKSMYTLLEINQQDSFEYMTKLITIAMKIFFKYFNKIFEIT